MYAYVNIARAKKKKNFLLLGLVNFCKHERIEAADSEKIIKKEK